MRTWIQHFSNCGSESGSSSGFGSNSGSRVLITKFYKKIYSWKLLFYFFWSKMPIYLSLGLHKRRPSYSTWKHEISSFFSNSVAQFCTPRSGSFGRKSAYHTIEILPPPPTFPASSVGDKDPDPHVFGPPGSGSISQMYGYGSGSSPFLITKNFRIKLNF